MWSNVLGVVFGVGAVKAAQTTYKKVYFCYDNSPPWIIPREAEASLNNTVMERVVPEAWKWEEAAAGSNLYCTAIELPLFGSCL